LDLTTHSSLSPIRRGFAPGFVNYKKGCTRLAVASDKVYQLLPHGRWFSPGTPASFTTKTGRHDIAEILLKVALKHQKSIKSRHRPCCSYCQVSWSHGKSSVRVRGKKLIYVNGKESLPYLGKGYFVTVNQFLMTIVERL